MLNVFFLQMTGTTHLERGQNFEKMLNGMGGIPATQTIDYVEGVSHNSTGMFLSDQGLDKVNTIRSAIPSDC